MTLANQITILRIILIPVTVIMLVERKMGWAFGLLLFSTLTDLADGLAARIRGEQTLIGAFLDPMADKLLLASVYLTMTALRIIDIWVFVVIFSRDLLIVLGWGVIYILTGSSKLLREFSENNNSHTNGRRVGAHNFDAAHRRTDLDMGAGRMFGRLGRRRDHRRRETAGRVGLIWRPRSV